MKRERKEIENTNDPYFQKGKALGLQALDPLSSENLTDEIRANRNQFLQGYAQGLKKYIKDKNIILPIMNVRIEENFAQPYVLLSYSNGLKRSSPNIPDNIFGEDDKELGEIGNGFRAAINAVENISKSDGYFIGFLVGVVRDYGVVLNRGVPNNNDEYALFMAGFEGKPFDSIPDPYLDIKWYDEFSKELTKKERKSVYEAGIKIRSLGQSKAPKKE